MGAAAVPVRPPIDSSLAGGFSPVFVTDDDIDDLASFFTIEPSEARKRLESYRPSELGEQWLRAVPQTDQELVDFYASTDLIIWELMQWHASASRQPYWDALEYVRDNYPSQQFPRVFDFGAGVGTDALFLADAGYDVTVVDVPGMTLDFARHRFARRGLQAEFVTSTSVLPEPNRTFDIALCFDVLEHLPDPLAAVTRLLDGLRADGALVQQASFGHEDEHPCHLHDVAQRFGGLRWHIHLSSLGLRSEAPFVYRRTSRHERNIQRARVALWKMTGTWLVKVPR
jgi:SAM-dependent methyltransferase